jgi:DUF2971 family protein
MPRSNRTITSYIERMRSKVNKYPEHDQKCFYKFTSMETAKIILESGHFRYSSPLKFNDPFDIQSELFFEFDINDLPELVAEEIDSIVLGRRIVSLNHDSDWCKSITLLQEQAAKGRYKRQHLDFLVKPLIILLADVIEDTRVRYNSYWADLLKRLKVFCVSEHNKSILMWSHYAKYHTGVCLKLVVLPDKDNALCAAKKVDYVPSPPSFFNVNDWIDSVIMNKELATSDLYYRYPLSKSDIWDYENEWRVWAPFEDDGSDYLDVPIVEGEIESIYFGCNADPTKIEEITALARHRNVSMFYRAEKKVEEYGLNYIKI